jgi:hypothetical protein
MSVIPTVSADGVGAIAAGQLNAYTISCYNTGILRTVVGQTGMTTFLQGTNVPNDGGQGSFYWDYTSTAADNNSTVIRPYGVIYGAWIRTALSSSAVGDVSNTTAIATGATTARTLANYFADMLNVKDFGAVGDGTTNDTASIQAALNTGRAIYFPNGTYLTGQVTVPTETCLVGESLANVIISPYGTISGTGVFYLNSASFVEISNFTFLSGYPVGANAVAISTSGGSNNYIHDIYINSYNFGIFTTDTADSIFERITVTSANQIGIYVSGSTSYRNKVINCTVLHATVSHGIQIAGGKDNQVSGCECTDAKIFGISIFNTQGAIVSNNTTWNTIKEGINLENSTSCIVVDNNISWTTTTISTDFGLSLFGADPSENNNFNVISGNYVGGPAKSGIVCAEHCQFNIIQDNIVVNPNTLNEANAAGILIYGIGGGNNFVTGNTLFSNTGYMYYGINDNDGVAFGNNVITNNWVTGEITAKVKKTVASVEALNTYGYTAYTPTVTSQTGTITSYTAAGGYYEIGKMVYITVSVTITTAGTGSGGLIISIPSTNNAVFYGTVSGREQTGGKGVDGIIAPSGSTALVFFYDNATPIVTGNSLVISGFYQRV